MTVASVDGDPFSFSAYTGIPSPRDGAFTQRASASIPSTSTSSRSSRSHPPPTLSPSPPTPDSPATPIVRIGPPSPTTEAFLQNPHDSAMWSEVLPPSEPIRPAPVAEASKPILEPSLSSSQGRIRSQTFSSTPKNFSRPFVPPTPASPSYAQPSSPRRLDPIDAHISARRPSSPSRTDTLDSAHPSPIDRSSSLGHASSVAASLERFSSIGHSSQTSHGTYAMIWVDEGKRARGLEEEARRAIALARGKSLRDVADRRYEENESVLGMEELRTDVGEDAYGGEEMEKPVGPVSTGAVASGTVAESKLSPPPPPSAYSVSEYDDSAAQSAVYSADEYLEPPSPFTGSRPPPSPPVPPAFQLSPSSPLDPHGFARSPFSPSSSSLPPSSPSQLSSAPSSAAPRRRNVLRKPRPPHSSTESAAMARSVSDTSSGPSESSRTGRGEKKPGVWSRIRSKSKSRTRETSDQVSSALFSTSSIRLTVQSFADSDFRLGSNNASLRLPLAVLALIPSPASLARAVIRAALASRICATSGFASCFRPRKVRSLVSQWGSRCTQERPRSADRPAEDGDGRSRCAGCDRPAWTCERRKCRQR
ncbi:hypothetical protein BJY59DRAFT_50440 [Rhodotorula toruloides]